MGIETETGHMIGVETNRTISLAKSIRRRTRVVAPANNFPQGPFSLVAKLPPPGGSFTSDPYSGVDPGTGWDAGRDFKGDV